MLRTCRSIRHCVLKELTGGVGGKRAKRTPQLWGKHHDGRNQWELWERGGPQGRFALQGSLYITVQTAVQDVTIHTHKAAKALSASVGH